MRGSGRGGSSEAPGRRRGRSPRRAPAAPRPAGADRAAERAAEPIRHAAESSAPPDDAPPVGVQHHVDPVPAEPRPFVEAAGAPRGTLTATTASRMAPCGGARPAGQLEEGRLARPQLPEGADVDLHADVEWCAGGEARSRRAAPAPPFRRAAGARSDRAHPGGLCPSTTSERGRPRAGRPPASGIGSQPARRPGPPTRARAERASARDSLPPARRMQSPRARVSGRACSRNDQVAERLEPGRPDPAHRVQFVDRREGTVLRPVVEDLLAGTGPTPGRPSSCSSVAVLRCTGPCAAPAAPAAPATAPAAPRRGTTTCSPSATGAARLTAARSAFRVAPPARASASAMRAPCVRW